jgi:ABC-type transport system involved in cytochrome bd biosynthesis fused ATPase/permease subunit
MLTAIIGEAEITAGKVYGPTSPSARERDDDHAKEENWIIPSAYAYVAQVPWIEHATVKQNILFGLPFFSSRYEKVLYSSALKDDLDIFPDGDNTEIGPSGINLSGKSTLTTYVHPTLY